MESLPDRPQPDRPVGEIVRAWLHWFGLVRLVGTAAAVLAVGAGAYWLLRAPMAPVENTLPMASRSATTSTVLTPLPPLAVAADGALVTSTVVAPAADVVVYVAGAVARSGVYDLPATARVDDAVSAAGGLAADADVDALNLAAVVRDGDRIYVPRVGQPVPAVVGPQGGGATASGNAAAASAVPAGPVDLNRATAEDLDALPGVGPSTAAAIIAYRDENGPFGSVDDLLDVRGIGPAKLDAIRSLVAV